MKGVIEMTKYENLLKAIDEYVEEVRKDKPEEEEFLREMQERCISTMKIKTSEFKLMIMLFEKTRNKD